MFACFLKYPFSAYLPRVASLIKWCTAIAVSVGLQILTEGLAQSTVHAHFAGVFLAAVAMWIFRLVPECVPAMFVIVATLWFDRGAGSVMLSGFHSDSLFLASGLFVVGYAIVKSGLFVRLSLWLLCRVRPGGGRLQKLLFGLGILMTPCISVQSSRVALMAPLLDDILASARIEPRSTTANALATAAFQGCILMSALFVSGKSGNALLYAMISRQNEADFGVLRWIVAASLPCLLLAGAFWGLQRLFFRNQVPLEISPIRLKDELQAMGSLSSMERSAIRAMTVLTCGFMLLSWLHVSGFWVSLPVFGILLRGGCIGKKELYTKINWHFLVYFGAIIGIMRYIQISGMDVWLSGQFSAMATFAGHSRPLFIAGVYLIAWMGGLLLGTMTAPPVVFAALAPLASQYAVNVWVVAFVVLMATESWIFPWQSTNFLCFRGLLNRNNNFRLRPLLQMNLLLFPMKLGTILVSIPFWHWLGFIA